MDYKKLLFGGAVLLSLTLTSCDTPVNSGGDGTSLGDSSYTKTEVEEYMNGLKETSESDHLYFHYKRHENASSSYNDWDVWAWAYQPFAGEGARFDWIGRTTSSDKLSATGSATIDGFGGAYIDIDLKDSYDGGWDSSSKTMGGYNTVFEKDGQMITAIGLQIVKSESRTSDSGFWVNDGGNLYVNLEDYALTNDDGSTSYHIFVAEDHVQEPSPMPLVNIKDPFEDDDGTNTTYGHDTYNNVDWNVLDALQTTSPKFLKGDKNGTYLQNGAGVGYQIMVSSFKDTDGDGFGDIYGITQSLDYLEELGVDVLWLTPIQLSSSYHGYDIVDYTKVDPRYGSKVSPNTKNGVPTEESAMEDYMDLLEQAHAKGMAVIMDLVLNHTSTENIWFINSAQLEKDYRGYYQWGNHVTDSDAINEAKFWYPYGSHVYSYYAKFGSNMPELNYSYVPTREAVVMMAKSWLQKGVDGFRLDAVKHIFMDDEVERNSNDTIINDVVNPTLNYSSNLTKNLHFWRYFNKEIKIDFPNAFIVGENLDGHAYHVAPFYEGLDSLFDFYTYYNLTSAAAHARNTSVGESVQRFTGVTTDTGFQNFNGLYSADNDGGDKGLAGNKHTSIKYDDTSYWDLKHVYDTYHKYRTGGKNPTSSTGYEMIVGSFTSNHDIARVINRIAGSGNVSGIQEQGNVTKTNYESLLKSAALVEIAELMLPGLTWIYYGDEIGMTGNFKEGQTSTTSYADLAYRQPMKWVENGEVGDGSGTTGYQITGSGTGFAFDDINSSSLVKSVEDRASNPHYQAIKEAANLKSGNQTLIRGLFTPYGWGNDNQTLENIMNFSRTLGNDSYTIVINFDMNQTYEAGLGGEVAFSFNGATATKLPPQSAIVMHNV